MGEKLYSYADKQVMQEVAGSIPEPAPVDEWFYISTNAERSGALELGDGVTSDSHIYGNVNRTMVSLTFNFKPKAQVANNGKITVVNVPEATLDLIGRTYIALLIGVGGGKVATIEVETYGEGHTISFRNNSGSAIAANTTIIGSVLYPKT